MLMIRKYGDPILKQQAKPLAKGGTPKLERLIEEMAETMYDACGVGLAAPQVGESIRLFIMDVDWVEREDNPDPKRSLQVFINPLITEESLEDSLLVEGCLSVPGIEGEVYRSERITLKYTDLDGESHEDEFSGMAARCIQHEIDHLDGILFIDRKEPGELMPEQAYREMRAREKAASQPASSEPTSS
jgi:peptide deformylase